MSVQRPDSVGDSSGDSADARAGDSASRVSHADHVHHHAPVTPPAARRWIDYAGAGVGLLCAIHCALTPLALILSPIAGFGLLWREEGEELMLLSLIALALISALSAAFKTRDLKVTAGFIASLTLLLVSHELADQVEGGGLSVPLIASVIGGVGVMLCHLWSLKLQRQQRCCE